MNLVIDIGNTKTKIAVFNDTSIIKSYIIKELSKDYIIDILFKHPKISHAIISTVKTQNNSITSYLRKNLKVFIDLNNKTRTPVTIKYKTPKTLGRDRIAAICGANNIYNNSNVLVFDLGTAITIDHINERNEYLGGNISPGIQMRFKALNNFTDQLPLLSKSDKYRFLGDDTTTAIISGVQNSIIFEIERYIEIAESKFENLTIIMTGGDSDFFVKKIKKTIFAEPNLVPIGLNAILKYNV